METPLRAAEDITFTHGNFPVGLGFSCPLNAEHIPASTIAEGTNWMEANAVAMEDGFGPVLDALSLTAKRRPWCRIRKAWSRPRSAVSFSAYRMAIQWRSLWPDFPWNLRGALGVGRSILEAAFAEDCGEAVQYMPITTDLDERGRFPVWDRLRSIKRLLLRPPSSRAPRPKSRGNVYFPCKTAETCKVAYEWPFGAVIALLVPEKGMWQVSTTPI